MKRGHFDSLIDRFIVFPFVSLFRWCDRLEHRWIALLSGEKSIDLDSEGRGAASHD